MAKFEENVLDWLRDAHAMECQAEKMLSEQASRIENYPKLKSRIEQHITETQGQRQLLESCIERLGGKPSSLKDVGGKLMAMGQALGGAMMTDEIIKGSMSGYVFENVEIAMYTTLIAAAQKCGDEQTLRACQQILAEEQEMARWLLEHMPEVTTDFLIRSASPDLEAKR